MLFCTSSSELLTQVFPQGSWQNIDMIYPKKSFLEIVHVKRATKILCRLWWKRLFICRENTWYCVPFLLFWVCIYSRQVWLGNLRISHIAVVLRDFVWNDVNGVATFSRWSVLCSVGVTTKGNINWYKTVHNLWSHFEGIWWHGLELVSKVSFAYFRIDL